MPPKKQNQNNKTNEPAAASAAPSGGSSAPTLSLGNPNGAGTCFFFSFPDMQAMADVLARVSSFLEDPLYLGKALPIEEFNNYAAPAKRYAGHNFSLASFQSAIDALEKVGLTPHEKALKKLIQEKTKKMKDRSQVYIIAHVEGDVGTFLHEKQHATYFFCADYRKRIEGIWGSVEKGFASWAEQFQAHLGKTYNRSVWLDEFQAIILNREYECATRVVQLLQSVVPPDNELPYKLVQLPLPVVMGNDTDTYDEYGYGYDTGYGTEEGTTEQPDAVEYKEISGVDEVTAMVSHLHLSEGGEHSKGSSKKDKKDRKDKKDKKDKKDGKKEKR